jgi:hypothetical protein
VLVTGQKVFLRLGQGELDIQPAAVTEHHDEEGKSAAGVAHRQKARVTGPTPVGTSRLNGVRQIVIAELMVASDNFTNSYVEALILGPPKDQRVKPVASKKRKGFSKETIARPEDEMATLERDFKAVEASYGQNVLHLTLIGAYLRSLLANTNVARFLSTRHPGIFYAVFPFAPAKSRSASLTIRLLESRRLSRPRSTPLCGCMSRKEMTSAATASALVSGLTDSIRTKSSLKCP